MARTIIEEVANCRVYDDGTILVRNVRFSYPHLDKPWAKKETDRKKYSLKGLMPKKTHRAAKDLLKKHGIDALLTERNKGAPLAKKDLFLRNGDDSAKAEEAGMYTVSASETDAPSVRGKNTKPIPVDKIAKEIQGGFWGDMLIRPWFQDNEHGKKINAGLVAVQLKKEDETFGEGGRVSEDDIDDTFDAVDDDDDSGFDEDEDDL